MEKNRSPIYREILEQPQAIARCAQSNEQVLNELAERIRTLEPVNVIIAARGTSDHVAHFAKYLIELYCHIPVSLAAPSVISSYNGTVQMAHSLVIGISQSGMTADVVRVIRAARMQGALVVGITNHADSLLAQQCQYHLYCNALEEKTDTATKSFLTQLYLIAQLVYRVSESNALKEGLQYLPEAMRAAYNMADDISKIAKRYRFVQECFILSRGISYPIAMEAALKLQEMAKVRAHCGSVADFNLSIADANVPAIMIGTDRKTNSDIRRMLDSLQSFGTDTFLITNDTELASYANESVCLPEWCNHLSGSFAATIVSQLFACEVASCKGLDS